IKAITANGGLSLRAHTDAQQIWADQGITVQSTTDEIRIQAKDSITLSAGQSAIVIKGGDITFTCPGNWTVKGATHEWGAGGGGGASLMVMPSSTIKPLGINSIQFVVKGPNDQPIKGFSYELVERSSGAVVLRGVTDGEGCTERYYTDLQQEDFEIYEYFEFGQGISAPPSPREHAEYDGEL
ncbi:MAG: DUF2345 domain-containing protein, partial [Burkholderiales bacterium]|nr:DUF2345 domain-containing protein [Burkholderiales bacterium]